MKNGIVMNKSGRSDFKSSVATRLKEACEEAGLTGVGMSKDGGFATSTINNWLNGVSAPSAEFLAYIQNLGIDVGFILTGSNSQAVQPYNPMKRNLSGPAPAPVSDNDAIYVPLYSATGSMGPGNELVTEDVILGDVPLSRTWISNNLPRCRPTALKMVHAYGDSMHGTLESGDFALVDTDVQSVEIDGVYVLQAHNRLFIKRVRQRMDGCYEVSSDNPAIKQTDILSGKHEVHVCGRVVYGWNGRRF